MASAIISVHHVTKTYPLYQNPTDRLKEALNPLRKKYHKDFHALDNISFEINRGETVGIIGRNGSGKSTLLKIIAGVLTPTSGRAIVRGKVSAILELGAGFNPEMTGMENIYLSNTINGIAQEETDRQVEEIIEFAELGKFIHQPLKTYSSGMAARLAFGVAIHVKPEILIIDEALSVGDIRFQQKCLRRMDQLKKNNTTILFVSHSTGAVETFCSRAIWIHEGMLKEDGDSELVCKKYFSFMTYGQETTKNTPVSQPSNTKQLTDIQWQSLKNCESFGEGGARITGIALVDENSNQLSVLQGGEKVRLLLKVQTHEELYSPIIGFIVKNHLGVRVMGTNTYVSKKNRDLNLSRVGNYIVELCFSVPFLQNGEYTMTVALAEGIQDSHVQHHWVHDALVFKMQSMDEGARLSHILIVKNLQVLTKEINHA